MNMRCDECKFWDRRERTPEYWEENYLRPAVGRCEKAKPYWETTEWKKLDVETTEWDTNTEGPVRTTKPEFIGLKMFVQDGSDYSATLLTTPDFYCAHFDRR